MSPMYTRRPSNGSSSSSSSTTNEVVLQSGAASPLKHLRSKPRSIEPMLSFRETTGMDDDDDDDDDENETRRQCWYELKEEDEEEEDTISTTRRRARSNPEPRYHSVPNNTPMMHHLTTSTSTTSATWNSQYRTKGSNAMNTATRLLFHDFVEPNGDEEKEMSLIEPFRNDGMPRRRRHPFLKKNPPSLHPSSTTGSSTAVLNDSASSSFGSVNMSVSSASPPSPITAPHPGHVSHNGGSPAPLPGRKRNSLERRPPSHPTISSSATSSLASTPVMGNTSGPCEDGTTTMDEGATSTTTMTPKMSPNSYITMDGRFVQSKNPFSSPMVVNHHLQHNTTSTDMGVAALSLPAFPMTTTTTTEADNQMIVTNHGPTSPTQHRLALQPKRSAAATHIVPQGTPVSQATVGLQAFSFQNHTNNDSMDSDDGSSLLLTFPSSLRDRRNTYVCSPILESPIYPPTTMATSNHHHHHHSSMIMSTADAVADDELPTSGSLHKVRRIHRSDDIFAASHHHLSHLRQSVLQQQHANNVPPPIDTTTMTKLGYGEDEEDISPTDVMTGLFSQPQKFFAPTPVVPKHGPPPTPMKPARASNVLLFTTTTTKTNANSQLTPHPQRTQPHQQSPSRRVTSPSSPVGLPPVLTRKVLQPRTPLVTLNPADRSNMISHPQVLPYRQKPLCYDHTNGSSSHHSCCDHPNEEWMFESDNQCGYTDVNNSQPPSALYHNGNHALMTNTYVAQPQPGALMSRFYTDFDVIDELGHGSFGSVYKVLSRLDGCMYAIKAAKRQAKGIADRDRMLKEVYALAALSDQADTANFHIVRYHQAWMEDDRLYIQTELCSGTLSDEMNRTPPVLNVSRRYKLLREMLLALDFIHRHNMVHLDIKPENIFIKNDQYKLGDFGLVTKASSRQDVEEGDSRYMSMELLSGDNRSDLTKSDIFSLGITMYEICLGRQLPMNGEEWQDIRAGKLSPLPNTDHDMVNIIKRMMDPNPLSRPAPASLLKHPQLLSDEEKALNAERTKVIHANIQLAAQQQMHLGVPVPKRALTRANTWCGSSLPYL